MGGDIQSILQWLKENQPLLVPALSGAAVSVYVSETKTLRAIITRGGAGLFCALVFTDTVVLELGRDPATHGRAVAGLLAMTGFEITRWFSHLDVAGVAKLFKEFWKK